MNLGKILGSISPAFGMASGKGLFGNSDVMSALGGLGGGMGIGSLMGGGGAFGGMGGQQQQQQGQQQPDEQNMSVLDMLLRNPQMLGGIIGGGGGVGQGGQFANFLSGFGG